MEGRLTIAMNTRQEVCVLQLTGGVAFLPEQVREEGKIERVRRRGETPQVLRSSQIAAVKVSELTQLVKKAFAGTSASVIR